MRRRTTFLPWLSIFFILTAVGLAMVQLVQFSRIRTNFPRGLIIAGVPVGTLDRQAASQKLLEAYAQPVELLFQDAIIHLDPAVIGFELNMENMLAAGDLERVEQGFWDGFWNFLWARQPDPRPVPLDFTYSEPRLRTYLENEIAPRYNQPAVSARPAVGTVNFIPGVPGVALDVDNSVRLVENALRSTTDRTVSLPLMREDPPRLPFENLQVLLKQAIDQSGFDGLVGLYLLDLQTAQEINFEYQRGDFLFSNPDVAYTAASIIKIPIMVSVFSRINGNADEETLKYLDDMIELSGNDPADWVMEKELDPTLGPILVTDDMQKLGLENTFMAGHFYLGAPLLVRYETPANQRTDINTDPDVYNQTTPVDMGMLLTDIYQCAQNGGGAFAAVYSGEITQSECQTMINLLNRNQLAALIKAGTPDGTQVAHKHGWVTSHSGVMNSMGDAGIVYTPGGNYVLVIFMYHPVQLVWDPASGLVAELSQAVYNFYNLPQ